MKLFIDTEGFLVPAAKAAEIDIQWNEGDWQRFCRHDEALAFFQEAMLAIIAANPGLHPVLVFGDRVTFRAMIWPSYKANRKKESKVAGWPHLVTAVQALARAAGWGVEQLANVEADDAIGILAEPFVDVIASIDKDLLTIPGDHFRNGEFVLVGPEEADEAFFMQTLTGDKSDNYPGCPGIGEVKARQLLAKATSETRQWAAVVAAYEKAGKLEAEALVQARCARILRPGEYDHASGRPILWQPPVSWKHRLQGCSA